MRMIRLMTLALFALALPAQDATDVYYIAFLRRAPGLKALAPEESTRLQTAHMANIISLAARGVLVAAGPFGDTPSVIAGVFVFKTASLAEAKRFAEQDPTVTEHRNL